MVSDKIMSDKWPLRRVSTNIVNRSSSLAYSNLGRQPFKKELGIFWVFFFVFVFWLIIIQPWPSPGGERERPENESSEKSPGYAKKKQQQ